MSTYFLLMHFVTSFYIFQNSASGNLALQIKRDKNKKMPRHHTNCGCQTPSSSSTSSETWSSSSTVSETSISSLSCSSSSSSSSSSSCSVKRPCRDGCLDRCCRPCCLTGGREYARQFGGSGVYSAQGYWQNFYGSTYTACNTYFRPCCAPCGVPVKPCKQIRCCPKNCRKPCCAPLKKHRRHHKKSRSSKVTATATSRKTKSSAK